MKTLRIIFVDQLSKKCDVLSNIDKEDTILFYEPLDTFYEISHHKHKLVFLISSLREFIKDQSHKNIIHRKVVKNYKLNLNTYLKQLCSEKGFKKIVVSKPSDFKTYKDLMFFCQSNNIELEILKDKKFISSESDFTDWSSDKKTRIQEYYYRWLRKKYNIFMNDDGTPIGAKWNFDKDNRKGISQLKVAVPERKKLKPSQTTFDTMIDVEECFPKSPGNLENFNWATSHKDAEKLLDDFLDRYFENYGSFQDAINKDNTFMFHSLLSPYLNSGLLDPLLCIKKAKKK